MSSDPFAAHLREVQQRSERSIEAALAKERSHEQAIRGTIKAAALLDVDIQNIHKMLSARQPGGAAKMVDCKAACPYCCYRSVSALIPEALAIGSHIQKNFTQGQQTALRERIEHYKTEATEGVTREPCPLLENDLCSVYPVRPVSCRGINSLDVNACKAAKEHPGEPVTIPSVPAQDALAEHTTAGLRSGLLFEALESKFVDLALALDVILKDPEAPARYVDGQDVFADARLPLENDPLTFGPVVLQMHPVFGGIPKGPRVAPDPVRHQRFRELWFDQGADQQGIESLSMETASELWMRVDVPRVYRTEEVIGRWREYFVKAVEDVEKSSLSPKDLFDGLSWHHTMNVTYQGLNDREILGEHGRIVSQIASKAVPEYTQEIAPRQRKGRIRLGYISSNMKSHNGSRWAHGWLKNHADDIETYAINVGTNEDDVTLRFKADADHYFQLARSVVENARFIKNLDLDVLIFTDIGLSARGYPYATLRMAPVQCTAWGHPDTSGLPTIDYYLSSDAMEPENAQEHYTEKVVRLPGSGLCYPRITTAIPQHLDRAHFGLPASGPILLMAQTLRKCLPQHDWIFAEITKRLNAPLVMLESTYAGDTFVTKQRLKQAGVNTHWIPFLPRGEFLRLIQLSDVSLDPFLWSGGNTSIEALTFGKPVVTLPGPMMRGRHTFAFLKIAGAPGLVANSEQDYIELACDFDRQKQAMINVDADVLYEDTQCVKALDEFVRSCAGT